MFSDIIYLELFVALFFLPGFFITVILGIKKFRFLLSFALSYSLLVLTLLPFEYYAQPVVRWQWCVLLEWVILAVWATACLRRCLDSVRGFLKSRLCLARLMIPLVLAGIVYGYVAYAGPYLEIPSDAWTHVYRFQWHKLSIINNGVFPSGLSWDGLFLHHTFSYWHFNPWYFIHAWLCHVSGLPIMDSLLVFTFVNVAVFLLGFYYFGLFIFAGLRVSALSKMIMAALASLFAAATMGNMVFAFIRYYAFAPAILNYVLFLTAMAVILAWLRSGRWFGHALWIAPVLLVVAGLIHPQESLFVFFMTLALGIMETVRALWRRNFGVKEYKSIILTAALLIVFFAGFAAIRYFKPVSWISAYMILPGVAIPPEPVNFIFNKLLISPPHNPWLRLVAYQLFVFYQVVGLWGLFVYLLFFLMLRRFIKLPYLMAGMVIVPFLTAFNPLTVDMMARMGQDPTLYRFLYMIPLPFVGGYLFVCFLGKAREFLRPRRFWLGFVGCLLVIAGLLGLVFPIDAAGIYAPYSKVYTLRRMPAGNDCRLWNDLGKFMEKHENKIILTDYLTRFMAPYFPKNNCICSTWLNSRNPEKYQPDPYTWESLRGRGMIIINRRDGGLSVTGRIAKHWPEDVLQVSRYYSPEAQAWLESHPEIFRKIWEQNRIAVYAVR